MNLIIWFISAGFNIQLKTVPLWQNINFAILGGNVCNSAGFASDLPQFRPRWKMSFSSPARPGCWADREPPSTPRGTAAGCRRCWWRTRAGPPATPCAGCLGSRRCRNNLSEGEMLGVFFPARGNPTIGFCLSRSSFEVYTSAQSFQRNSQTKRSRSAEQKYFL